MPSVQFAFHFPRKRIYTSVILFTGLILTACGPEEENPLEVIQIESPDIKGYVVPSDSISEPTIVPVDTSKLDKIDLSKPEVFPANTHIHSTGNLRSVRALSPVVSTPGSDTFSLPLIIESHDSIIHLKQPIITPAQTGYFKHQNPKNFGLFNNLYGLKDNVINDILQDKSGNLWICTKGAGLIKYDSKAFIHYTNELGLRDYSTYSILEDKEGNIWIGHNRGITMYNGVYFKHFYNINDLSNGIVTSMLEDRNGTLWFGTYTKGLFKYDGKVFSQYTMKQGLSNNHISTLLEDKSGKLWIGTEDGLCTYDGNSFNTYNEKHGLSDREVTCLLEDNSGKIWFGTRAGGVNIFDGKTFTFINMENGLSSNSIYSILQDRNGEFFFGTWGEGISVYDGKKIANYDEEFGISDERVTCIMEDREGNIWIGTALGGINRYDGRLFRHYTATQGFSDHRAFTIYEDHKGQLWFGRWNGGLIRYNGETFAHYNKGDFFSAYVTFSILEDRNNNLWLGFWGGGLAKFKDNELTQFSHQNGLKNENVYCFLEDRNGNIWFGTDNDGVYMYDGKAFTNYTVDNGLSNNVVFDILEDKKNNLWFSTYGGGITKYNGKTFTHFTKEEGLTDNYFFCNLEDRDGNLWFGGKNGLILYDGVSFTSFTEEHGLSNNTIKSIIQDKNGNIVVGTDFGINILRKNIIQKFNDTNSVQNIQTHNFLFDNYTYEDGFLGIKCYRNALYEDRNGVIWIGANDRLTAFYPPFDNEQRDTLTPNIQITSVELYNENIPWLDLVNEKDKTYTLENGVKLSGIRFDSCSKWYNLPMNLTLAYNNNFISFNYVGITMHQPDKVQYQYTLEGLDNVWSSPTSINNVQYGNLPPNSYTFKVRAISSKGHWSDELEYSFTIRTPWWETLLFKFSAIILIGSIIIYLLHKRNAKNIQERHRLEAEVLRRTQIIRQQAERLRELDKIKTKIYTNITHEFRTPLTLILGLTDFFEGKKNIKELIQLNVNRILNLINQLLELRAINSGYKRLNYVCSDIINYIDILVKSYEPIMERKHIELVYVKKIKFLKMDYDPEKLLRVISNLLSNAIKFTNSNGTITITLDTIKEQSNDCFNITVADTGIGIPEKSLKHIFERFYQVQDSNTIDGAGTGIGLSLCKELVELMNGRILVQSTLGKGSIFKLMLPVTRTSVETMNPNLKKLNTELSVMRSDVDLLSMTKKINTSSPTTKPIALIVEDNEDLIYYIHSILESSYMVLIASNGQKGIEMALDNIPDIIISDIMMPGKDGFELCQVLKQDTRTSHIPIILLTALTEITSRIDGLRRGADAYIEKPFHKKELLVQMENLLEIRKSLKNRYASMQLAPTDDPNIQIEDQFISRIYRVIEENLHDPDFTVKQLSTIICISRSQLHRKLIALSGLSANMIIKQLRLKRAKFLLVEHKDKTIAEVAYTVGFADPNYFSRVFSKEFGKSPSEYIKQRSRI